MRHIESGEQQALIAWADLHKHLYPELGLLFHIPNGGKRNKAEAARLKREGVRAGVPDLFLPVAAGGRHGLFIELKAGGGSVTKNQEMWLEELGRRGYAAWVCFGWREAAALIVKYLGLRLEV